MIVLGINGGITINQHEPSASLSIDGRIVASCEEERYSRNKSSFGYLPTMAINKCLQYAKINFEDIDLIVSSGETYDDFEKHLVEFIKHNFGSCPRLELVHHHVAHVASAFYGSGLESSLCLSLDAGGDGISGIVAYASKKDGIKRIKDIENHNSIGLFYTMMTYYLGYITGDEYKVMGLAPYGEPSIDLDKIISVTKDGWKFDSSFMRTDPKPRSPFEPMHNNKLIDVLGKENRIPGSEITQFYKNIAASTQKVTEEAVLNLMKDMKSLTTDNKNLCYSGGVALNCSLNRKILYSGEFENIYIPPIASDNGLAAGCAYLGANMLGDETQPLNSAYLGLEYSNDSIYEELKSNNIEFEEVNDPSEHAAKLISENNIIGWHQGRSEAGARALGNRSILANPENENMKEMVNAKIKYRESFRPFAPSVAEEDTHLYFDNRNKKLPYMNFTVDAIKEKIHKMKSVVHFNNTSRIQMVSNETNNKYHSLLKNLEKNTGAPVVMNTSFNLKGQPIVETPRDAIMTFFGCGLDALVIGNFVVRKK
jgi:carbamoyltransferase